MSGTGTPILPDGGAPTSDSDIFVANVDDLLDGVETPRNITNTPDHVDDDPDWSPDGARIVYTRYDIIPGDPVSFSTSDIYLLNADGSGEPTRLTDTARSERAPEWSPDGNRIVYMCPRSDVPTFMPFEICVINADGTNKVQLTNNTVNDLGPHWSPDGQHIVFQRPIGGGRNQVFVINANGTGTTTQITGAGRTTYRRDGTESADGTCSGSKSTRRRRREACGDSRRRRTHDVVFDAGPRRARHRHPGLSADA